MNEFDQFYSSFVPTYPPSGEDSITALLRVYEKLVKFDKRVEKSFILGTIDVDVDMTYSNFLRQYVREGRDAHIPPPSFQHDGIVGVIPFSVAGDSGVLLLDLQDFKAFTPRIMNDFSHPLTTKIVGYELRPNYKAVFEYSSGMDYIGINHYKATSSSRRSNNVKERTDILYIGRSLCSFVQTTQKAKLLEPIRIISKFSRSGILQAYVKSSIEDCTAILYTDSPIANDYDYTSVAISADKEIGFYIKLELVELYKDTLSKNQEKFIRDVGNRLGLTQGKKTGVNQAKSRGGTLRDGLEELAKICGVAPNFNKDVYKEYLKIYDGPVNKFGCTFKNARYETEIFENSGPEYSRFPQRIREYVKFETKEEFTAFLAKVNSIMSEEYARFPFSNVDPYIEMFRKFNPSKPAPSFSRFYSTFLPTYPPSGEDGTTALLRVYERLVELDKRVEKSFILGTKDEYVNMGYRAFVEEYVQEGKSALPPSWFQHEGLVGVIPISVGGATGVVLLDLKDFKSTTPVIMNNLTHSLHTETVKYNQPPDYKNVFRYFPHMVYIGIDGYKGSERRYKERTDILYFGRSLCNFVQTTQKANLLEPIRKISKFSESGELEASVTSSIKDCKAKLYIDSLPKDYNYTSHTKMAIHEGKGCSIELNLGELTRKNVSESKARFIRDVGNRLGLKQGKTEVIGGPLVDSLKELAKTCGKFSKYVYITYLINNGGNVSQLLSQDAWLNKFVEKITTCLK